MLARKLQCFFTEKAGDSYFSPSAEGSFVSAEGSPISAEGSPISAEGSFVSAEGSPISAEGSPISAEGSFVSAEGSPISVAVLSANCVGAVQVQMGCLEAGVPYVPLNPLYNANELAVALNDAQSPLIFVHDSMRALYEQSQSLGIVRHQVQPVYFTSHDNLNDVFDVPLRDISGFVKSDVGQVLFTSGTTSKPKGCASFRLFEKPPRKHASLLPKSPINMFLVTNACGSIFYPMMRLVIASKGHVEFVEDELTDEVSPFQQMFNSWASRKKTVQLLFGDQLFWVLAHYTESPEAFKGLEIPHIFYGGLKFPVSALEELMNIFPKSAYTQFYGSTEGGIYSVLTPEDHREKGNSPFQKGSAGKILEMSDLRIVGLNGEGEVSKKAGIPGELQVGTSLSMKGYWLNPKATAEEFVEDENGKKWFRVGDIVQVDKHGYLYVMDRIKDMIILNTGRNVFCSEIEDIFSLHDAVKEVCCFGVENADKIGESIAIAVVPEHLGHKESEKKMFQSLLKEYGVAKLPLYKVPSYVFIVDEIPRTKNSKILRREIRDNCNKIISGAKNFSVCPS
ncbi:MAG: class I adenylate-forming enzyme family protein [Bacteroidota bacterium]